MGQSFEKRCMNLLISSDLLTVSNCLVERNQMKNRFIVGAIALLASGFAAAQAAPTTSAFTTAVTSVSADIATFGGALIGVAAVGVGFMVAMKYVKKIRGAA